jgi:hypothetical protein
MAALPGGHFFFGRLLFADGRAIAAAASRSRIRFGLR